MSYSHFQGKKLFSLFSLWYNLQMLDLNRIRRDPGAVKKRIALKGVEFREDRFKELDERRRQLLTASESLKSRKNALAKETGIRKKKGEDTRLLEEESIAISTQLAGVEDELKGSEAEFENFLLDIPNIPLDSVPEGTDASMNVVVRTWGEPIQFPFHPRSHWELGEMGKFLDFTRAVKIAASRFALSFGAIAKLERVLMNLMLDTHTQEHGYTEVVPPFLVNSASLIGTGNLPKFKADLFKVEDVDLYLIPTAEVPLTNIHRDEFLQADDLPLKYVAYSPCFRSEAGSHGRDIRGLIRLHQFNKVELMKFTTPEQSADELERLTRDAEAILRKLQLPYRVVVLCTGDMSFSSAKTYDIEVWMPERGAFMEISSCSNFTDFQARRAKIKYKTGDERKEFVHTLNGSGLAIGRTIAAILENYQEEDGKVRIPEVLKPYYPQSDHF